MQLKLSNKPLGSLREALKEEEEDHHSKYSYIKESARRFLILHISAVVHIQITNREIVDDQKWFATIICICYVLVFTIHNEEEE